jgi:hypothetical protein
MKKNVMITLICCLVLLPALAHAQIGDVIEGLLGGRDQRIRSEDLRVLQLNFLPDPVREGQRVAFRAVISNNGRNPGRVSLYVRDKDQIISEVRDIVLRPGNTEVDFPAVYYRFSRTDTCFSVEVDIARNRIPVDMVQEFCARRSYEGWTLSGKETVQLFIENVEMFPDPVLPGRETRFSVKLRNDGRPTRGDIRIENANQTVVRLDNVAIPRGLTEFQFPRTQYAFQPTAPCLTVFIDIDRTPNQADGQGREYCLKPTGWSLKGAAPDFRDRDDKRR